jgi:uncharacterized protein (TIGR00299 family) protein
MLRNLFSSPLWPRQPSPIPTAHEHESQGSLVYLALTALAVVVAMPLMCLVVLHSSIDPEIEDSVMHIHLDPVGGVAGDMFVAALLDAFPEQVSGVINAARLAALDDDVVTTVLDFNDGVLTGKKFNVRKSTARQQHGREDHQKIDVQLAGMRPHDPSLRHHHPHREHTHWPQIREQLSASPIPDGVKRHALGIFGKLAWAEAMVHGKEIDVVTFHELGNCDSIADIVAAAALIDALTVDSWSISSMPIGQGRVGTAHGELPVPAPATALLLEGFAFHHDGRPGERVTPTGAAILKYLAPTQGIGTFPRVLRGSGHGFGTQTLPGMSNILRALVFDAVEESTAGADEVGVIQFEIDDQSGEDLAAALDHIRASVGVIDVTQAMAMGKKGRMMAAIQVLVVPEHVDDAIAACFRQTTTLGLRTRVEARTILTREEVNAHGLSVKVAERPGGRTAKAESDGVAGDPRGHRARATARLEAEITALKIER